MGRSPCCDKLGLKKGPWTPEEDQKLLAFIEENGHGNWRALPSKAGLQRCGKSCRLRWTNYLRPDIKRGKFSLQEEQTIIQLHALLGNRWSAIATHLPKRTDNEIKNYWNTHLKKRLTKMGIDPVTHKPKNEALLTAVEGGHPSKNAANLSHMAQWESARLEAEARLVRQSKLRSSSSSSHITNNNNSSTSLLTQEFQHQVHEHHQTVTSVSMGPLSSSSSTSPNHYLCMSSAGVNGGGDGAECVDILKGWNSGGGWPSTSSASANNNDGFISVGVESTGLGSGGSGGGGGVGIESPTSTLSFSENTTPAVVPSLVGTTAVIEFLGQHHEDDHHHDMMIKKEGNNHHYHNHHHNHHEWMSSLSFIPSSSRFHDNDNDNGNDNDDEEEENHDDEDDHDESFMEGFTELLLSNNNNSNNAKNDMPCEKGQQEEDNCTISQGTINTTTATTSSKGSDYYEDNKTYWNSILNLVNSSPHSPMF